MTVNGPVASKSRVYAPVRARRDETEEESFSGDPRRRGRRKRIIRDKRNDDEVEMSGEKEYNITRSTVRVCCNGEEERF